jgi:type IV pilus assembly protein PilC
MARFEYSALTESGRLMTGTLEAASPEQAGEIFSGMKLNVSEITLVSARRPATAIGRNEFMLFNQQLASLTKASIPLEKGLRELASDIGSRSMRRLITEIADELEHGVSIEDAFERHQRNFPPLYGRLLKAGVETGRLSEMLTSLNRHLDIAAQTRRIIFEAVAYPLVVLLLGLVIITAMFTIVVPQFASIMLDMVGHTSELPLLTQAMFKVPQEVGPFWLGVAIFVGGIFILRWLLGRFAAGRTIRESLLLNMPVLGHIYKSSILSRMAEAMAMMVAAGTDMPTALRLAAGSTGSERLIRDSEMLARGVEQGSGLMELGQYCRTIPRLFLYSIVLGSQRNELQDNLYSLGQMYSQQARSGQGRLQALLLPLMLILVGGLLGICILGLFLPLIKIITSLT